MRPDTAHGAETAWGGQTAAVDSGDLRVLLTPRPLLELAGRWLPATG